MVLAQPVQDKRGVVILNEGFILTPAWSDRLKMRKVEYVFVHDTDQKKPEDSEGQKLLFAQDVAQSVDSMFQGTGENEIMVQLAKAAKKYLLRKKLKNP